MHRRSLLFFAAMGLVGCVSKPATPSETSGGPADPKAPVAATAAPSKTLAIGEGNVPATTTQATPAGSGGGHQHAH